jgi:DNA mismatch endonuclease, patch repair protein
MADVFSVEKRSAVMSRIQAKGNRDTELRLITLFCEAQIPGWRRNKLVFGKPDFVFPSARVAVFVDGCFWHRHAGCKFCYTPKTRVEFWLPKFERNVTRDRLVTRTLRKAGWKVVRIWECQLGAKNSHRAVSRIKRELQNKGQSRKARVEKKLSRRRHPK